MFLDWLISFCMAFSGQAVITYAAVKMLRATRPAVIWAIAVVGCMVTGYSNALAPSADFQAAWSAFNLVLSIVTYIVFSGLRPIRAALVVACIMLVTLLAEFATVLIMLYGFGVNITSGPAFAHEHPGAYLFLMVFHAIVLGLLFYAASVLLDRFTAGEQSRSLPRTMLFPASQAVMLLVAIVVVRVAAVGDEGVLLGGALVTLAVLALYLAYYLSACRIQEQEIADARVAAAEERGALMLQHAQGVVAESERIAKLRHDFRNRVQVVELLSAQGEGSRAQEILDKLLVESEKEACR